MRRQSIDRSLLLRAAADGAILLYSRTVAGPALLVRADGEDEENEEEEVEEPEPTEGRTPVIASTQAEDRYGDIIVQEGWELENFKANPVILPAHSYGALPVGRGEGVGLSEYGDAKALGMDIVWDMGGDGARWERLYNARPVPFMRGVSVGLRPIQFRSRSSLDAEHWAYKAGDEWSSGSLVERQELVELSTAPVPVNQEALSAKALGLYAAAPTPEVAGDSGVLRALRKALRSDLATQREIRRLFRAFELSQPEPRPGSRTFSDVADWLTS